MLQASSKLCSRSSTASISSLHANIYKMRSTGDFYAKHSISFKHLLRLISKLHIVGAYLDSIINISYFALYYFRHDKDNINMDYNLVMTINYRSFYRSKNVRACGIAHHTADISRVFTPPTSLYSQ